jgi:hypothetical protein
MAGQAQRIAELERQVAELAAEVKDLRVVRAVEDIALRYAYEAGAARAGSRRPVRRHLSIVAEGRS